MLGWVWLLVDESNIQLGNPLDFDVEDQTSWVRVAKESQKQYPVRDLSIKVMTGFVMLGDLSQDVDYKTHAASNKIGLEAEVIFRRASNLMYNLQRMNAARTRLIMEMYQFDSSRTKADFANIYRSIEFGIVSPIKEPFSDEKEEMADELMLKTTKYPTLEYLVPMA